ncbi:MAG TPA: hypothetical protein PKY87_18675 [Terricaulis sp.]|nr:hypothetical protein [Terricaulis sp.]
MLSKPLWRAAGCILAIAAFAACAHTAETTEAPAASAADEARAYVESAEAELATRSEYEARIAWVYQTYINYDTEWLLQRTDAEGTEARVRRGPLCRCGSAA